MKRNAQAALLALMAFAVLPAKSTPSTSLTLAHASFGIDGEAPGPSGRTEKMSRLIGEGVLELGKTDDLPGLIAASLTPDAVYTGVQDRSLRGFEPDLEEEGRADPAPPDASAQQDTDSGGADATTAGAMAAIADASEPAATLPATATERENAPKSRLTYIGLIKPEHIVREQRCLAEAIYFEARSESADGRAAVAQVVLNRVKSGAYPGSVCGVVYQNRHRKLACQFTFACEGKALRITEAGPWQAAMRIAREVYEGRIYLADVGAATHYHADYVQPRWAKKLTKMDVIGRHIFYS
jgi:spore germination cell wall hydrolase CwlJ-like protein